MNKLLFLFGFFSFVIACGGGPPAGETMDVSSATPNSAKPGGKKNAPVPEDKKAKEAAKFCKFQAQKSAASPFASLSKKDIQACVLALRPAIRKDCSQGVEQELSIKLIISGDGSVQSAFATGNGADSPEAVCTTEKIKSITFPAFTSKPQIVIENFPVIVQP